MAFTQQPGRNAYYEDQTLTRAAPTTSATDGVAVKDLDAFTVVVQADSGQTLSGAGTIDMYMYDDYLALWVRVPELDTTIATSGVRQVAYNFVISGSKSLTRILPKCTGVTVSSGTTARIYVLGGRARGA